MALSLGACDDLDQYPSVEMSSDKVYASADMCKGVLAECYMSFVLNGNGVTDINVGGEALLRSLFNLQEGTTDAVAYTWLSGDKLDFLTYNNWNANDQWVKYVWYRCYVTITSCNDFITSELEDIAPQMSSTVSYPRATKGAAYALLTRIYLNSKVYAGVEDYDKCVAAADNCEKEGYALASKADYWKLFGADNHNHAGKGNEIIFAFYVDADNCKTWGASTNIISGFQPNTGVTYELVGIDEGWSSMRANKAFTDLFSDADDIRSTFWWNGDGAWSQLVTIEDEPTQGWISIKFNNKHDDGTAAHCEANNTAYTDLPVLRLAEVKLNKAEALYRQGKTSEAKAIFDEIRSRAGASTSYTLDDKFILDERGREMAYESLRRTDLIRFNKFGGEVNYNWEFKGGAADGKNFEAFRNVFPIPSDELAANPNLKQNAGY